jgi:drug/metabolite transporter (DMT)-like permease
MNELDILNENNDKELATPSSKKSKKAVVFKFKGFLLVMISGFFISLQNYFMRKAEFFNAIEQTSFRYLFQLITLAIISRYYNENLFGSKEFRFKLLIRGFFGTLALLFLNISVKLINPSDTIALFFSNVIIVAILARIFFNEKFSIASIIAIILMLIGIILISKPSFILKHSVSNHTDNSTYLIKNYSNSNMYIFGFASALIAAFFASGSAILLKKLTVSNVHFSVVILFSSYVGFPVSLAISLVLLLTKNEIKDRNKLENISYLGIQILFAFLSALTGCIHQIALNISYRYEDASKISIYRTLDLIFSFIMQFFLLNINPGFFSLIG